LRSRIASVGRGYSTAKISIASSQNTVESIRIVRIKKKAVRKEKKSASDNYKKKSISQSSGGRIRTS
jgi:hypothetical protein